MSHVPGDTCQFCGVGTWEQVGPVDDMRLECSAVCGAPPIPVAKHGNVEDMRLETCAECGYFFHEGAEACVECGAARPLVRTGNCYEAAVVWMVQNGAKYVSPITLEPVDARLCHGWPTGTGGDAEGLVYGHAWVEYDVGGAVMCYDTEKDMPVPQPIFYRVGSIDPAWVRRYGWQEMVNALVEHEHYGPWEPGPEGSV